MKYFIGIDGGGTKTAFVLSAENGVPFEKLTASGGSYQTLGAVSAVRLLYDGAAQLLAQAKKEFKDCAGCCIGLPCYGENPEMDRFMTSLLEKSFAPVPVYVVNDVEVGWAGSLECREGIHVVSGTGSIAFGRGRDGQSARCGGWDEFYGDEGSCYWIGRQTMSLFSKEADGRAPKGPLYDIVRRECGLLRDFYFTNVVKEAYAPYRAKVAAFQNYTCQAAEAGDTAAAALYQDAARELALMVRTLKERLSFSAEPVDVSYSGGLFQAGELNVTGLCHSVQGTAKTIAKWCGAKPEDDVQYTCAGINHQAFYLDFTINGKDAYPLLREAVKRPEVANAEPVRNEIFRSLGYYQTESSGHNSEYSAWFRKRPDLIEKYCTHGTSWNPGHYAAILQMYLNTEATWEKEFNDWLNSDDGGVGMPKEYSDMLLTSFKTNPDILKNPTSLWPNPWTVSGYVTAVTKAPFLRWLSNSLIVTCSNVVLVIFTSTIIGFVFAKYRFPKKELLFTIILATMMVPAQVTMIPSFLIINKLGLYNTLGALIVPGIVVSFGIFMCRQFIEDIPDSLCEAAKIDGASDLLIYGRIVVPNIKSAIGSLAIFMFLGVWNDYLTPLIIQDFPLSNFRAVLEQTMLEDKSQWVKYYHGSTAQKRYARAFSYSDRARYYLTTATVQAATKLLLQNLDAVGIPMALLSQYLPVQSARVYAGALPLRAADLLIDHVGDCIDDYLYAVLGAQ